MAGFESYSLGRLIIQKEDLKMADLITGAKQVVISGVGHGENLETNKEHEMHVLSFYNEVDKSVKFNSL